ncbi:MAG: spore coat associated protein CotJA [Desulfotomaculaceae bacterium]|nr:spore coat associated protein CotJA [Desulfotomaculaceae bacterium]
MPPLQLAHAYVPWQHMGNIFSPAEGLARGTIFPELLSPYSVPKRGESNG